MFNDMENEGEGEEEKTDSKKTGKKRKGTEDYKSKGKVD